MGQTAVTYLARQILWVLTQNDDWKNATFVENRRGQGSLYLKTKSHNFNINPGKQSRNHLKQTVKKI